MLAYILIGLAVIVVLFLIIVAKQPDNFRIERAAKMAAPAETVFAQVNDFHNWEKWSPWLDLDPAAKQTYSGAAAGKGAGFAWAGNNKVGEGRMTILDSQQSELIRISLEFFKPMANVATAEFTFKPDGGQTAVTWSMFGKQPFMGKLFCLFMNMDKMIGGNFDTGLGRMKKVVEDKAKG